MAELDTLSEEEELALIEEATEKQDDAKAAVGELRDLLENIDDMRATAKDRDHYMEKYFELRLADYLI